MKTTSTSVQRLTKLALLLAIELAMRAIGLGAVPVGPLNMSFLTLPIAIAAMLCGPVEGMVLGAVFGILSLTDAISGRSLMTGTFFNISPDRYHIIFHSRKFQVNISLIIQIICPIIYIQHKFPFAVTIFRLNKILFIFPYEIYEFIFFLQTEIHTADYYSQIKR